MAGRGPAPKDPAQRRRRNKQPEFKELPREGNMGAFPPLPRAYRVELTTKQGPIERKIVFLKATREWYDAWGRSPMATQFTAVDWHRLQRVARLVDQYERVPDPKLLAEVRLQEAGFGGTPMDRRRLGQKIADRPAEGEQPQGELASLGSARQRRLSAVK